MTIDGRRARGTRSRWTITRHAVDVASVEGLNGLSIGRLADDLGLSKSGIATLFRTKEQLQLATIETAQEVFLDAVVRPVSDMPPGPARLRALIERWISYAEQPLFTGGCFWAANLPAFDSRPGPIRDALRHQHQGWLGRLVDEVRHSAPDDETPGLDPELTAFQIDAVLTAANTAMRFDDPHATQNVRRVIDQVLTTTR